MSDFLTGFKNFIKINFLPPHKMNWGYPVFIMSTGLLISVLLKLGIERVLPFTPTSLAFCSLMVPLMALLALIVPSISLSSNNTDMTLNGIAGTFTGVGPLIMAFFSGVPLSLLYSSLHNLSAYLWLRMGNNMVFPAFMCYNQDPSLIAKILEFVTQNVIPSLGICLFFTGIMWSLFKDKNKYAGMIIIIILFAAYSLNVIDLPGTVVTGIWILLLRKKTDNIFAPFLALVAMKITEICFASILSQVDITTLQTYSDIPVTFFYSSIPAIFVAMILFSFFKVSLDDFERIYYSDLLGRESETSDENVERRTQPVIKGINLALIISVVNLVVVWILSVK